MSTGLIIAVRRSPELNRITTCGHDEIVEILVAPLLIHGQSRKKA
jgi:hypothetical protein